MMKRSPVLWSGAVLAAGALAMAAALLAQRTSQRSSRTDGEVELARQFLDGSRGASPLACEMLLRSMGIGYGWRYMHIEPGGALDVLELVGWGTSRARDPAVVPVLRAAMDDADPCVRRVATRLLGGSRMEPAIASLLEALADSEARTRELAALGLGYAERRSTVDPLIGALGDATPGVRAAAAWALGEIEDPQAADPLVALLRSDPDPAVRRSAAIALGNLF